MRRHPRVPNQANSGAMTISQGEVSTGYSTADLPLTLTVNAGDLSGLPGDWEVIYADGVTQTGTGGTIPLTNGAATLSKIIYQGMSFSVAGAPADGDSFTIERNAGGVQDGRNAVLLGKLQTATTMVGGQATFQSVSAQPGVSQWRQDAFGQAGSGVAGGCAETGNR